MGSYVCVSGVLVGRLFVDLDGEGGSTDPGVGSAVEGSLRWRSDLGEF